MLWSLQRTILRLSRAPSPAATEIPDLAERIRSRLHESRAE
jgi:hypothetical protein